MIFALIAAVLLAWLLWSIFEDGPTWTAALVVIALVWALIDKAG